VGKLGPHLYGFCFGFNKQKFLSAAEKYVPAGQAARTPIAEYEKILKADAKI